MFSKFYFGEHPLYGQYDKVDLHAEFDFIMERTKSSRFLINSPIMIKIGLFVPKEYLSYKTHILPEFLIFLTWLHDKQTKLLCSAAYEYAMKSLNKYKQESFLVKHNN